MAFSHYLALALLLAALAWTGVVYLFTEAHCAVDTKAELCQKSLSENVMDWTAAWTYEVPCMARSKLSQWMGEWSGAPVSMLDNSCPEGWIDERADVVIILFHGRTASPYQMLPWAERFSQRHYNADFRWWIKLPRLATNYSQSPTQAIAAKLVSNLIFSPKGIALVGVSYGTRVAIRTAQALLQSGYSGKIYLDLYGGVQQGTLWASYAPSFGSNDSTVQETALYHSDTKLHECSVYDHPQVTTSLSVGTADAIIVPYISGLSPWCFSPHVNRMEFPRLGHCGVALSNIDRSIQRIADWAAAVTSL
jgi:hypothetical protein